MRKLTRMTFEQAVKSVVESLHDLNATATRIRMPPEAEDIVSSAAGYHTDAPRFAGLPIDFSKAARPEVAYVYGEVADKGQIVYEIDLTDGTVRRLPA